MPEKYFRPDLKHPEPWQQDLNPNALAGQNVDTLGPHPELNGPTAFDVKAVHRRLHDFSDDQLKSIPVLPAGTRLEQGATYIDLHADEWEEFKALGNMEAGPQNWYVPKSAVHYAIWNRLIGVDNPERVAAAQGPPNAGA